MIKRIAASICVFMFLLGLSACSPNRVGEEITQTAETTVKETRIYNHFKDAVPEFKFKNTPTEEYNEGISYVLRVEASEKEVEKYIKALQKAGFTESSVQAEKYFAARNSEGYHVELTNIDGILTLYVRKMS